MTRGPIHIIEVRGDFACFSRPEMKVERWSYPCPTPSAARGMFDAIYFKPQFYWQVLKVELLREPVYIALRRNETGSVASVSNVKKWIKGTVPPVPLMADNPSQRQQRQTMAIRNPYYRLHAQIVPHPGFENQQQAYDQQFIRRARQGKCAMQPGLGCREFVAFFHYVESLEGQAIPVDYSQKVGWMLYDVFDLSKANDSYAKPFISMFDAMIKNGVLDIPPYESVKVLKPVSERRAY